MGVDLRKSKAGESGASDAQLQHAIDRDVRAGQARSVLALHISQLQAPAPRPYHRRIAKAMLDDAAQNYTGQVFARGNSDMVLICEPAAAVRLRDTLARLFRVDAPAAERLLSLWTLPNDAVALGNYLSQTIVAAAVVEEPSVVPGTIGAMDALIGTARLTDLIRRQMAVQLVPGGMAPLYRELTFSMEALDTRVNGAGAGAAQADPYLFRHLAGRLDTRMMDLLAVELARPGILPPVPALHLNLTVRAILSPGFLRLTEAAEAAGAGIGVEIALIDACADARAFGAAHMVLRAHGCTVVLDTIGHQALLMTRLETLDPDLVKLDWAPRIAGLGSRERRALTDALNRVGPKRLVLHRVEARAAVAWGMTQGITRFQGRHIDALLAAGRLEDCPHATKCTLRQCSERAAATGAAGRSGCLNTVRLDLRRDHAGNAAMRPDPIDRLTNLIRDCQRSDVARQVLLVRTDRLPPTLSRPHHLRLAEAALIPLMGANRALRFELPGPRYAITWRGEAEAALLEVLRSLKLLLTDPPPGTPPLEDLVFLYDLPHQSEMLLGALYSGPDAQEPVELPELPALDTDSLALLEIRLAQANVARFARRQPIWRLDSGPTSLAWEKRTLSVKELTAELLPGCNVQADPWLFRRLTRTLDRRMLSLLASPGELAGVRPFALDLNVANVLSPEFLRFDAALPTALRGRVVIELMPADIMADAASFVFARGFARARGYRLMLRNATPELLRMLSIEALELDHVQLRWNTALADAAPEAVGAISPGRMVLFRANGPEALDWGARAGIRLFQGTAADAAGLGERSSAA